MADGGGPARRQETDLLSADREMRRVYPDHGPKRSEALRKLREQNQAAFEKSLRMRQRPTRVS